MKNYAGHRLSPWLGHLMVSRSETARQLLTQGEIMDLPEDDEIVMMSGIHPIRAKKARYYEDRRLTARVLPPPDPANWPSTAPRPDSWSQLPPILPAAEVMNQFQQARAKPMLPAQQQSKGEAEESDDSETGNADLRREPGLERHVDIAPPPRPTPANEFDPDEQEPDADAVRNRAIQRDQAMNARRASMDRDDGIEL